MTASAAGGEVNMAGPGPPLAASQSHGFRVGPAASARSDSELQASVTGAVAATYPAAVARSSAGGPGHVLSH